MDWELYLDSGGIKIPLTFLQKKNPQQIHVEDLKIGGDLLSRNSSTIGADRLNFSVRNGKR